MSPTAIAILVVSIVIFDLLFTWFLLWAIIRNTWQDLVREFPAQPMAPDVVTRDFQSFRYGIVNLGFSIHVSVDEQYMHMQPAKLLRIAGAQPVSLPWTAIELEGSKRATRTRSAKIGTRTLMGPAWCLELAAPDDTPASRS